MSRRLLAVQVSVLAIVALAGCVASIPEEPADDGSALSLETIDGKRVVGGDIVVEPEDEMSAREATLSPSSYARQSKSLFWPGGLVPFTIDSSVSSTHRARISAAIGEWQAKTSVRFVKRKAESAYVTFIEPANNGLCSANLGHIASTRRYVYLRDTDTKGTCNQGVMVHELGHTLGLVHEHQRPDRDQYVKIDTSCIPDGLSGAFAFTTTPSKKIGAYDIGSTMHYRSTTLTKAGCYSITAKNGKALLHDWSTLSAGDVAAMAQLYPSPNPPPAAKSDAGVDSAAPPPTSDHAPETEPEGDPVATDLSPGRSLPRGSTAEARGCAVARAGEHGAPLPLGLAFLAIAMIWIRRRSPSANR